MCIKYEQDKPVNVMKPFRCLKCIITCIILTLFMILCLKHFSPLNSSVDHHLTSVYAAKWFDTSRQHQLPRLPEDGHLLNSSTEARTYRNITKMTKFLKEQQRRTTNVLKICEMMNETNYLLRRVGQIYIDKEDALTFCPIYKAASTSWSIMLLEMRGLWNGQIDDLQQLLMENFKSGEKTTKYLIPKTQDTNRFLVVRHPFERLVSCYRDKYENNNRWFYYKQYGQNMILKYRNTRGYSRNEIINFMREIINSTREGVTEINFPMNPFANPPYPTFEEFSKFISFRQKKKDDEHWKPYYDHCSACALKYNFIFKFENLKEESEMFLHYLNKTSKTFLRWDNPTSKEITTSEVVCSYFAQIDLKLAKQLKEKYKNDFLLYEYDPDPYLKCVDNNDRFSLNYGRIQ